MSTAVDSLELRGRIYRDPDSESYVSVLEEWDIATCGRDVAEAVEMTWHLIDSHLAAARKLGTLERELAKVGAAAPPSFDDITINLSYAVAETRHRRIRE